MTSCGCNSPRTRGELRAFQNCLLLEIVQSLPSNLQGTRLCQRQVIPDQTQKKTKTRMREVKTYRREQELEQCVYLCSTAVPAERFAIRRPESAGRSPNVLIGASFLHMICPRTPIVHGKPKIISYCLLILWILARFSGAAMHRSRALRPDLL